MLAGGRAGAPPRAPEAPPPAARPWAAPRPSHCSITARQCRWRARAAASDEWDVGGAAAAAAGGGAPPPPPPTSLEEALQASAELVQLCQAQLALLTSALQASLAVASDEDDDARGGAAASLRASVYVRAGASLQSGTLQLQLVAASDGGSGGAAPAQRFLFLEDAGGGSLAEQEQWILQQPVRPAPCLGGGRAGGSGLVAP